jgi:uncharacterized protein (DUF1697 family)
MKYNVFIKGINVGGNTKVSMSELKAELIAKKYKNVETVLNSGNLIVESENSKEFIRNEIIDVIKLVFAIDTDVFVLNTDDLEVIINNLPDFNIEKIDNAKLLIYFFNKSIPQDKIKNIGNNNKIVEQYNYMNNCLYVYYINGVGKSALTTNYIDKICGINSTGRNLNTLIKMNKNTIS